MAIVVASLVTEEAGITPADAGISLSDVDASREGEWQRIPTADKPRSRNGAVMVFSSSPLKFYFQNHATGERGVYHDATVSQVGFSPVQSNHVDVQLRYQQAAELAQSNWRVAGEVGEHPYLALKQVSPYNIRQLGRGILVPGYDAHGYMWTYQRISHTGSKRFLKGGRKKGCFLPIGCKPERVLLLAEGYATAASLFECLGQPVVVCFDAGNLLTVGEALHRKYPNARVTIAADNDTQTPGNPGVTKATAAARELGGAVCYPEFEAMPGSDWNDFYIEYGAEAVQDAFSGAF